MEERDNPAEKEEIEVRGRERVDCVEVDDDDDDVEANTDDDNDGVTDVDVDGWLADESTFIDVPIVANNGSFPLAGAPLSPLGVGPVSTANADVFFPPVDESAKEEADLARAA